MARPKISYEWIVECIDEHEDIDAVEHYATLAEAKREAEAERASGRWLRVDIALRKSVVAFMGYPGDEADEGLWDLSEWLYAYPEDGELPDSFEDGSAIPQRFRKEWGAPADVA